MLAVTLADTDVTMGVAAAADAGQWREAERPPSQANITQSAAELALRTENAMLIEQNHQLRTDLDAAHAELRQLRVRELANAAREASQLGGSNARQTSSRTNFHSFDG